MLLFHTSKLTYQLAVSRHRQLKVGMFVGPQTPDPKIGFECSGALESNFRFGGNDPRPGGVKSSLGFKALRSGEGGIFTIPPPLRRLVKRGILVPVGLPLPMDRGPWEPGSQAAEAP